MAKARDPVFGKRPFFFFGSKKKLTASDAEVRAATRIQARIRGNKARTSIQRFGDALFAPVKMVMDAGEEMIKGGGDLVQAAVGRKRAPAVSDEEVAAATRPRAETTNTFPSCTKICRAKAWTAIRVILFHTKVNYC